MKTLVPYLNNHLEEAISDISQIMEQHETIKLRNEELRMLH